LIFNPNRRRRVNVLSTLRKSSIRYPTSSIWRKNAIIASLLEMPVEKMLYNVSSKRGKGYGKKEVGKQ
jgi:hypothetical protein